MQKLTEQAVAVSPFVSEALSVSLVGFALVALAQMLRSARRPFMVGAIAATAVALGMWAFATASGFWLGGWPGSGLFAVVVYPLTEEAARAACIFSVLPKRETTTGTYAAFGIGYAAFEGVFKLLAAVQNGLTFGWDTLHGGASMLPYLFLLPFSFLLALSLFMGWLREIGVSAVAAFMVCLILHSVYNALGNVTWDALDHRVASFRLLLSVVAAALLIWLIRRRRKLPRDFDVFRG
jgi:hypothetical protein